jgi:hypothetical protein
MLNKLALAAINSDREAGNWPPPDSPDYIFDGYVRLAKAVLEALRDGVTDDVLRSGKQQLPFGDDENYLPNIFTAMINAALEGS